ncbi:putative ATPase [Azospirillum brasilense]|nr:AAA family ATPase [Azospirillum baldaniorum]NUB08107.1 AAA family ATPase [Azospirillum baldaniorum]TWA81844.1 putative ATPase [Azospirillum brasilense]
MSEDARRFVVVTGGPGSGKSTLIDALASQGHAHSVEAGRAIIQDQTAIGGPALPWIDPSAFAELMLCWELRSLRLAREQEGTVFFDRGIPDVIGYLRLMKRPVPAHLETAARRFRYHRTVFMAPPWPEIFGPDTERRQTLAEAVATHDAMVETYGGLGYDLVELPKAPVAERLCFVLDRLGQPEPLTP